MPNNLLLWSSRAETETSFIPGGLIVFNYTFLTYPILQQEVDTLSWGTKLGCRALLGYWAQPGYGALPGTGLCRGTGLCWVWLLVPVYCDIFYTHQMDGASRLLVKDPT